MKTIMLTTAVALLSLSSVAASAYPYGHHRHHSHYRYSGGYRVPGSHVIGSGDRHGTASGGPVGGFKSQP